MTKLFVTRVFGRISLRPDARGWDDHLSAVRSNGFPCIVGADYYDNDRGLQLVFMRIEVL